MAAYLVAHAILDPEGRFSPMIDQVQIASQPGSSFSPLAGKEVYLTILEMNGEYDEARKKIEALILAHHPCFKWCEPLYRK